MLVAVHDSLIKAFCEKLNVPMKIENLCIKYFRRGDKARTKSTNYIFMQYSFVLYITLTQTGRNHSYDFASYIL